MTLFDTGRLCVKTAGREAGKLCVVLDKAEKDFVLVTGPRVLTGVRKRKCNVEHLEPLPNKLKIKSDSTDNEILDAIKKEDSLLQKFKLTVPSAEDIRKLEVQRAEKEAAKTEREKKLQEAKKPEPPKETYKAPEEAKKTEQKKEDTLKSVAEKPAEPKKPEPASQKTKASAPKKEAKPKEPKKKE